MQGLNVYESLLAPQGKDLVVVQRVRLNCHASERGRAI